MNVYFLKLDTVYELHRYQLDTYGGIDGVREESLLLSALAMPQSAFGGQYLHGDVFEMAAAYLFHLVKNHPFLDGNKRIGASAAALFLYINGWKLTVGTEEYADFTYAVVSGNLGKPEIAAFFRSNVAPLGGP